MKKVWNEISKVMYNNRRKADFSYFQPVKAGQYMKPFLQLSLLTAFFLSGQLAFAQFNLKKQLPEKQKFDAANVIDSTYGIMMYERLNPHSEGDSIRLCGSYACQSWVEDFYTTGTLLHKGFYIDGQLKTYKNYFPNGNVERDFKAIDNYKATCKIYYSNGQLKSDIKYNNGTIESWTDYSETGVVIYQEVSTKGGDFLEFKKFFFDDGSPKQIMVLADKKKRSYSYTEYHPNGKVKAQGIKLFSEGLGDYVNDGEWKFFDESGKQSKTETYSKGEKIK
ncbi:MAG: toxin-antitoxin system YwqK family antitoxin [Flavobacteriales bacterium]